MRIGALQKKDRHQAIQRHRESDQQSFTSESLAIFPYGAKGIQYHCPRRSCFMSAFTHEYTNSQQSTVNTPKPNHSLNIPHTTPQLPPPPPPAPAAATLQMPSSLHSLRTPTSSSPPLTTRVPCSILIHSLRLGARTLTLVFGAVKVSAGAGVQAKVDAVEVLYGWIECSSVMHSDVRFHSVAMLLLI